MEFKNFDELTALLRQVVKERKLAVAAADDMHTLEAVVKARKEGVVLPTLFGNAKTIRTGLNQLGENSDAYQIVDAADDAAAAEMAVEAVRKGEAEVLMKGKLQTAQFMGAVINKEHGLLDNGVISMMLLCEIPAYHKLLVMTDVGIVKQPELAQKKAIVNNAVNVLRAYGYERPKVVAVCAVEVVNPKMQETVDAAVLKEMSLTGEIPNCDIEGPISMDIAFRPGAAKDKGFESDIIGNADIILCPNVLTGNIMSKAVTAFGGMKGVGIAVGARVPLVVTSRAASIDSKYRSILLAAAACRQ